MTTLTHDTTHEAARSRFGAGFGFAVLSAASFGASGPLADGLMTTGWSPAAVVLCRIAVAALVLAGPALVALRGRWGLLRANVGLVLAYGVVAVAGCQLAYFSAVDRLPVAIALLLEFTSPLGVIAWLWLRHGQRPVRITVAGAVVAVSGLLLVLDVFAARRLDGLGVVFGLLAMVGGAVYFVLSAGEDHGLPPVVLAGGGTLVGSLVLAVAGLVGAVPMSASTGDASYDLGQVPWWLPILVLGVVTAAIAYLAGIAASRRLGARLASFMGLMEVLCGLLFSLVLLGQLPHLSQLIGGVLVLSGVVLVKLGEKSV